MPATGAWVRVAVGLAGGVRKAGAGSVVTGAEALAVLLAAGAAMPVSGAGGRAVATAAGAVALEAGAAVDRAGAGDRDVCDAAGVPETAGAAAAAAEAAELVDGAWPSAGAVDWRAGLALAVGVAWFAGAVT
jgi:hypothetical protein